MGTWRVRIESAYAGRSKLLDGQAEKANRKCSWWLCGEHRARTRSTEDRILGHGDGDGEGRALRH